MGLIKQNPTVPLLYSMTDLGTPAKSLTLNVMRDQTVVAANFNCLNLIGAVKVTLTTANLKDGWVIEIINTSGASAATIVAQNTTINGTLSLSVPFGGNVFIQWIADDAAFVLAS